LAAAQSATLNFTVQNLGPGDAISGWKARFLLSSDATITNADVNLGEYLETELLLAGSTKTVTRTLTVPTDLVTGTRYYGVIVDAANQLVESNETNNARASATTVAVTGYPDLQPVSFSFPGPITTGIPVNLQLTARNQGGVLVPSGWLGQVLLSVLPPNATAVQMASALTSGAPVDLVVGSFTETATIAPGASLSTNRTITVPMTYMSCSAGCSNKSLAGSFYFEVRLDVSNVVAEGLETNNRHKQASTNLVIQPPDLVPALVTGPANATAGSQISVNTRVDNWGAGQAPAGWRGSIYLVGSSGPILVHQYIESAVASPGASLVSTKMFFLPASVTPGSYQLRLVADDATSITEANSTGTAETNNSLDGASITVSP
jgi:subtilase family serine protease